MGKKYNALGGNTDITLTRQKADEVRTSPFLTSLNNANPPMSIGWVIGILLLFVFSANAQVSSYAFSQSGSVYTPLTAARTIVFTATAEATADPGLGNDQNFTLVAGTLPFPFIFNGTAYTGVNINTNGYITFGSTLPVSSDKNGLTNTTSWDGSIIAVGRDLSANTNAANLGEISYQVLGSAPNRQFVIQYAKFRRFSISNSFTENLNFQIVLNEANGVVANQKVEIIYGACVSTNTSTTASDQTLVGLRGVSIADFNNRTQTTGWTSSTAGGTNSVSVSMRHTATISPASGQKFIFTPPIPSACPLPYLVTVTALTPTSAKVSWSGASSAIVEWGFPGCTAGTTSSAGVCGNVLLGTSPQIITGLSFNGAYSVSVRQNCSGSGNGFSANVTTGYTHSNGESCSVAIPVTVAPNSGVASNVLLTMGLTSDGPSGTCSDVTGNPSKKDTWASFVAPASGKKIVITTSSGTLFDTVMQVWSSCPTNGVAIGCNDDISGSDYMSKLEFCGTQYTPGATYYVQIWPYSSTQTGDCYLKIYEENICPAPPSNNECAGVATITVGLAGSCPSGAITGTTLNATASAGIVKTTCDAFGTYLDVFYRFNTGANTDFNFEFTNITGSNSFGIYSACGLAYLGICAPTSYSSVIYGLTPNTNYYIVVWANSNATAGTFSLCISKLPVPACVTEALSPTQGSTSINPCTPTTLSWASDTNAIYYDVYFNSGATATSLVSNNQITSTYNVGILLPGTLYSWKVIGKNSSGSPTGCSSFTFTTIGVTAPSCINAPISPVNGTVICIGPTNFSWPASPSASSYDVYIDGVLVSNGQTTTAYTQTLNAGTHNWRVIPKNCVGTAVGCILFTFTSTPFIQGDLFSDPFQLGTITSPVSVNGDTLSSNCWHNNFTASSTPGSPSLANSSNDVFYKFTVSCAGTLNLGLCASNYDTFVHLLNASGNVIAYDDDSCTSPNDIGSRLTNIPVTAGVYYAVVEGFATAEGSYTLDISTTPTAPCSSVVSLKLFIEGYFDSGTMRPVKNYQDGISPITDTDNITVELHNTTAPYATVYTTIALLKTNGTAICTFPEAPNGSFYIAVSGRNCMKTWSATPQTVGAMPLHYDFSTAANQAYGNNMKDLGGGIFGLYSGDINSDGSIDGTDAPDLFDAVYNSEFGIQVTDLNGDGSVDNSDIPFFSDNSDASIYSHDPNNP